MKFLILAVVVVLVLWIARASRRRVGGGGSSRSGPAPPREDMVACSRCGVHLPSSEALPGRGGVFCCESHRAEHERAGGH